MNSITNPDGAGAIALEVSIPPSLHDSMRQHLDCRPDLDQDRLIAGAIALYLMQSENDPGREVRQTYLKATFPDLYQ